MNTLVGSNGNCREVSLSLISALSARLRQMLPVSRVETGGGSSASRLEQRNGSPDRAVDSAERSQTRNAKLPEIVQLVKAFTLIGGTIFAPIFFVAALAAEIPATGAGWRTWIYAAAAAPIAYLAVSVGVVLAYMLLAGIAQLGSMGEKRRGRKNREFVAGQPGSDRTRQSVSCKRDR